MVSQFQDMFLLWSKTCLINTQNQAGLDQCLNTMDASLKQEMVNLVTSTQGGNTPKYLMSITHKYAKQ
jgi:ABC-type thiamine transport system ATPase subunit